MKALCWVGRNDLRTERVAEPKIVNEHDALVRVHLSSVCGSDLHLIDGYIPTMREGDILGHEFLGEIVEVGPSVKRHKVGDRVVVASVIGCGRCFYCQHDLWSLCDNSNPKWELQEKAYGYSTAGIFAYSHALGGFAGSHAEYVRVPFADYGAFTVPEGISDEQAVFASDAVPTGYMGAHLCNIHSGDIVAVWGCGAVGLMAMHAAYLMGAERVIGIDRLPERLELARTHAKAETINYENVNVPEALKEMTGGRGPDACVDAVGMESHGPGIAGTYDRAKQAMRLETDRGHVIREAIYCCRKGGTVSIMGVYGALVDKFPLGPAMNKGLTMHMGQQHGQKYIPGILQDMSEGKIDASYLLTHRLGLNDGAKGYEMFKHKRDGCVRAVFDPRLE